MIQLHLPSFKSRRELYQSGNINKNTCRRKRHVHGQNYNDKKIYQEERFSKVTQPKTDPIWSSLGVPTLI